MAKAIMTNKVEMRIRIAFPSGEVMGYGKAELLERIEKEGSIAAAGRQMGMSYKRAWQLVETMNNMFEKPLVESARGGAQGGGAKLTETGRAVLDAFRRIEAQAKNGSAQEIALFEKLQKIT